MEVNDRFCLCENTVTFSFGGIAVAGEQLLQGDGPEAHAGLAEEVAAGQGPGFLHIDRKVHRSGFHEGFVQIEQYAGKGDQRRVSLLKVGRGQ